MPYWTDTNPPIPIAPRIDKETYQKVKLINQWQAEGTVTTSKATCYFCDKLDPEYLIETIHEFQDASVNARLHCSTGPQKFSKFRECLGGLARSKWDSVKDANETNDTFTASLTAFLATILDDESLSLQEQYMLNHYTKKYDDSIVDLSDRIDKIELLCRRFPGAANPSFTELQRKKFLFSFMLTKWKKAFNASGKKVAADTVTRVNMIDFFVAQQEEMNTRPRPYRPRYQPRAPAQLPPPPHTGVQQRQYPANNPGRAPQPGRRPPNYQQFRRPQPPPPQGPPPPHVCRHPNWNPAWNRTPRQNPGRAPFQRAPNPGRAAPRQPPRNPGNRQNGFFADNPVPPPPTDNYYATEHYETPDYAYSQQYDYGFNDQTNPPSYPTQELQEPTDNFYSNQDYYNDNPENNITYDQDTYDYSHPSYDTDQYYGDDTGHYLDDFGY